MLKEERKYHILKKLDTLGSISVTDIVKELNVSDMTVRRDFDELESSGKLKRVRGGAISTNGNFISHELSHTNKRIIHIEQKHQVAKKAHDLIVPGDTLFLGPGTTIEILASLIDQENLRIITNCLPVFQTLNNSDLDISLYLIGGEIRRITQSFHGDITTQTLSNIYFDKAFFSCNAIYNNDVMTSAVEEGTSQKIALNNSALKFLIVDDSKIGKKDFYTYYDLNDIDTLIINDEPSALQNITADVNIMVAK
ncbi:MAG: DeoR/GlpR family DNA-binding transcription regulator [Aerococcus sp.]|nr:DeoR/GlpR family DNA-binding transcription regulator [Aerococcus sp.]